MIELFSLGIAVIGLFLTVLIFFWFIKLVFKAAFYLSAFVVGLIAFLVFFPIILALVVIGLKLFIVFIVLIPLIAGALLLYFLTMLLG